MKDQRVNTLVKMGLMAALSIVLALLVRFPLFVPFLEYDAADIPILIVAFAYGPLHGVALTFVVSVIQGITVSAGSGWIGIVMHFVSTSAFCLIAGFIYRYNRKFAGAVWGLVAGAIASALIMCGLNLVFMPMFLNTSLDEVKGMILPVILPFNLVKAGINSAVTLVLYKHVKRLFKLG